MNIDFIISIFLVKQTVMMLQLKKIRQSQHILYMRMSSKPIWYGFLLSPLTNTSLKGLIMKPAMKRTLSLLILIVILTSGCGSQVSETAIQTAIAQTQAAEPTLGPPTVTPTISNLQDIDLENALLEPEDIIFLFKQDIDPEDFKYSDKGYMGGSSSNSIFSPEYLGWEDAVDYSASFFSVVSRKPNLTYPAENLTVKYEQRIYVWVDPRDAARHTEELLGFYDMAIGSNESDLSVQGDSRIWLGTFISGWCTAIVAYKNVTLIIYINSSEYLVKDDLIDLLDVAIQKIESA
jgi:hypothetical protein